MAKFIEINTYTIVRRECINRIEARNEDNDVWNVYVVLNDGSEHCIECYTDDNGAVQHMLKFIEQLEA